MEKLLSYLKIDKYGLSEEIKTNSYSNDDYHVMYFGEILKVYVQG